MKKIGGFMLVLFLTACSQVYFATPQPRKGFVVKSFLENIQGVYADTLIEVEIMKNEVLISGNRFRLTNQDPCEDEVLVRFYNDAYFASLKDSLWYIVFMVRFDEQNMAVYIPGSDALSVSRLKRHLDVETIDSTRGFYLIDPSVKEFEQLINSGVFEVVSLLQKKQVN
ncbi:MAG: hypothetical protein JXR22_12825 [Prolixibacteraceae bacterium]|nr:hypothetical protein [Prolixibacteraceae bacterium]